MNPGAYDTVYVGWGAAIESSVCRTCTVRLCLPFARWIVCRINKRKKSIFSNLCQFEPPRDKTNNVVVRPAKTQISLGIRPVWSESSLSAWRKLGSLATHWAHSEDSDQTGRMPRLIWVFTGRTLTLLVLSRGGSFLEWIIHQMIAVIYNKSLQSNLHAL